MRAAGTRQATRILEFQLNQIRKLIVHIETMNWTGVLPGFNLFLVSTPDHPGPNEHPHSALLPHQSKFAYQSPLQNRLRALKLGDLFQPKTFSAAIPSLTKTEAVWYRI